MGLRKPDKMADIFGFFLLCLHSVLTFVEISLHTYARTHARMRGLTFFRPSILLLDSY